MYTLLPHQPVNNLCLRVFVAVAEWLCTNVGFKYVCLRLCRVPCGKPVAYRGTVLLSEATPQPFVIARQKSGRGTALSRKAVSGKPIGLPHGTRQIRLSLSVECLRAASPG